MTLEVKIVRGAKEAWILRLVSRSPHDQGPGVVELGVVNIGD